MYKLNYSVLMSVYFKEKPEYLEKSIDSMLSQTYLTNDFVIIKDGNLTKELEKILLKYQENYSFIHIYGYEKNKGLGYALNYGLEKCKNNLVARMDSDDISLPSRCEEQIKIFLNNPNIDIVGTSIYEFSTDENKIDSIKYMPTIESEIKKYSRRRNPFNHPTVMYKKEIIKELGGYPLGIRGEDFALFSKLIFKGKKGINIKEPLLKYRSNKDMYKRRSSSMDAKAVINVIKNNYKLGYISFLDLLIVFILQLLGLIIPKKLGYIIYKKLFRN